MQSFERWCVARVARVARGLASDDFDSLIHTFLPLCSARMAEDHPAMPMSFSSLAKRSARSHSSAASHAATVLRDAFGVSRPT